MTVQPLFEPFRHKQLVMSNCFVMDPTTHSGANGGQPVLDVASHYRRRTEYEAGLMLSEGAAIDRPSAACDAFAPHFYGEKALAAWQRVHDGVLKAGGVLAVQLCHSGITPQHRSGWSPVAPYEGPSDRYGPSAEHICGVAMDASAIEAAVRAYAAAASAAKKMGFVAIEINAANGALIDQFFWHVTNDRSDAFGGKTLEARTHFAVQVLRAVREAAGDDMTLIMRLSQAKPVAPKAKVAQTIQEMQQWLMPLVQAGVDILHCSQPRCLTPEFAGSTLNFAGWAKKITDLPVITSGQVGTAAGVPEQLAEIVRRKEQGEFDLVAVDVALARDPAWIAKVKHGAFSGPNPEIQEHLHRVI